MPAHTLHTTPCFAAKPYTLITLACLAYHSSLTLFLAEAREAREARAFRCSGPSSASCETPRAAAKRQGSPDSPQRLEAEVGLGHAQSADGLEKGIGRAGFAHAMMPEGRRRRSHGLAKFERGGNTEPPPLSVKP